MIAGKKKGVMKTIHAQQHDYEDKDADGDPVQIKKEKKQTTVVKPALPKAKVGAKGSGATASKGQQKQMRELCE